MARRPLMVQGTMSNVGKSVMVAGLCRVFAQDGYSTAPFKSQNMALNSWVTDEGLEMARAQVVQAEAAGVAPSVLMNPILLKPVTDMGSQVIVNGEVRGNMPAAEYFEYRRTLIPDIMRAYNELAATHDIVVVEGAGSPAEINLRENDIVNMGLAEMLDADVLLVGDIDPGGVFAQLVGTLVLLEERERARIKGLVINKFRGDFELLRPGLAMLEERAGKPVVGTLPYLDVDIEDEDSLSSRFSARPDRSLETIDIAVVRLPKISNFSDFAALEATGGVALRYVVDPSQLGSPDMVVLPGTKSTIADLAWLRSVGLDTAILDYADKGGVVFGLCGGYQMLGLAVRDEAGVEGGGEARGLGLLPIVTDFTEEKTRTRVAGRIAGAAGVLAPLNGSFVEGYEIHMGVSRLVEGAAGGDEDREPSPVLTAAGGGAAALVALPDGKLDGCAVGNVAGSYLHGFFDSVECRLALLQALAAVKGIEMPDVTFDYAAYKQQQYDILADAVREHLDMAFIYGLLGLPASA